MAKTTLTVNELAAYWGVTPQSVRHAAWQGTIPGCSKIGKSYVFDKEIVLAEWVPPRIQSWSKDLNTPGTLIAGGSGLTIEGGRKAILDASIARLHDLHVLVTSKKWTKIILKAVDQAADGDWRARKWLGDYLMGPPVQRIEAEVDITTRKSFSDEMRSQAIQALLQQAQERVTVDVTPEERSGPGSNPNREVPS